MWHCVEERHHDEKLFGRFQRKIVFDQLYSDRQAVISSTPLAEAIQQKLQVRKIQQ